jgi:hypothetical protein
MRDSELPEDVHVDRSDEHEPFTDPLSSDLAQTIEGRAGHRESGTYSPPTDPVITTDERGEAEILGGFASSSVDAPVARSSGGGTGDEALAAAVRRELREDAATAGLELEVDVRDRVAYIRGRVADMVDAENAEAVAGRVDGLAEVVDETELTEE